MRTKTPGFMSDRGERPCSQRIHRKPHAQLRQRSQIIH
ncbi:hypothetical protein AZ78_5170 [Lysobacter capsici AZ78]|uniref:Uncharacterized protein n=1 Tax=Lysobacter capsici AZ78 TaxID=1444315 RepID=A0A125TZF3_9GAMM|nr:hypothetical protein AZ78_5170 [Lysobacter capsici AZ78]